MGKLSITKPTVPVADEGDARAERVAIASGDLQAQKLLRAERDRVGAGHDAALRDVRFVLRTILRDRREAERHAVGLERGEIGRRRCALRFAWRRGCAVRAAPRAPIARSSPARRVSSARAPGTAAAARSERFPSSGPSSAKPSFPWTRVDSRPVIGSQLGEAELPVDASRSRPVIGSQLGEPSFPWTRVDSRPVIGSQLAKPSFPWRLVDRVRSSSRAARSGPSSARWLSCRAARPGRLPAVSIARAARRASVAQV